MSTVPWTMAYTSINQALASAPCRAVRGQAWVPVKALLENLDPDARGCFLEWFPGVTCEQVEHRQISLGGTP
jgi:hypothetical protein